MTSISPMDRSRVQITTLEMQGTDNFLKDYTPAERMAMVWPLTLDAWSFKDPSIAESRFQRHVVRIDRMDGMEVQVIGRDDLLINKRASGRPKDLADAATLDPPSAQ